MKQPLCMSKLGGSRWVAGAMEVTWLKKIAQQPLSQRRAMLEQSHKSLSLRRQCWLLSVSRAGLSYQPAPVDEQNLQIMRRLDSWYVEHPDLGHRRLVVLLREEGWPVNIYQKSPPVACADGPGNAVS